MRKGQRKSADNYIRLLSRAHDGLKKALALGRHDIAKDLLEQCQDAAIHLGGIIEISEGDKNPCIALLEEYCEAVYQIYEKIGRKQRVDANKAYKNLRKMVIQAGNIIKNDTDTRTEAVFLPYMFS